jgi:glycosyltransferase involved in cell wall biosynthesis
MIPTAIKTLNNKSRNMNAAPDAFGSGVGDGDCGFSVSLVIPAYNEQDVIGTTLLRLPSGIFSQVIVADNGSTDRTREIALAAGARVVSTASRGYGAACLAVLAMEELEDGEVLVFLQADGSEDAAESSLLTRWIASGEADLVIGSRVLGVATAGSLRPHQRLGNWLATRLVRLFWGVKFTDLGPFRAIRAGTLRRLGMRDRDYGWTVEMQVRAAQLGLRCVEVPVRYGLRIAGEEKVSGNWRASAMAGWKILYVVFRSALFGRS